VGLLLYAWTGYTCVEIGEILGRSTAAVRMLLVRARRRFRAAYGNGLDCAAPASGAADGTGDAAGGGTTAPRSGTGRGGKGSVGKAGPGGKKMDGARDHLLEAPGHLQGHRDRCEGVQEVLPFYPRGDLPRDVFAAVTRHLAGCARCRQALADVQATYRLLQAHLNTAPIGSVPRVKAAIMAGLALPAAGPDQPPASAPVPAPVVVRRAVHQEYLPWPGWPGWPGGDPLAPRSRR
jgi:hypothetical protein